jgi:hypothetical protein
MLPYELSKYKEEIIKAEVERDYIVPEKDDLSLK